MKKIVALLISIALSTVFISGCSSGSTDAPSSSSATPEATNSSSAQSASAPTSTENLTTLEAVQEASMNDAHNAIDALTTECDQLIAEIDTYDKYLASADKVEAFYKKIVETERSTCAALMSRAANYAEIILASDTPNKDKYNQMEGINDYIYEDAMDELNNGIYEDLFGTLENAFYGGILDDDAVASSYEEWYDARSNEYEWWYDARSDVYSVWYDTRSAIYSFYYDERSETYSGDLERAQKKLAEFKEDAAKMLGD